MSALKENTTSEVEKEMQNNLGSVQSKEELSEKTIAAMESLNE